LVTVFGPSPATVVETALGEDPTPDPFDNINDGTTVLNIVSVPVDSPRFVAEIVSSSSNLPQLLVGTGTTPSWDTFTCISYPSFGDPPCEITSPTPGDYWVLVTNADASGSPLDDFMIAFGAVSPNPSGTLAAFFPTPIAQCDPFEVEVAWNVASAFNGGIWYGALQLGTSAGSPDDIGTVAVDLRFENLTDHQYCISPNAEIPDEGQLQSTMTISDTLSIPDLNVKIVAPHTWSGDLIFTLEKAGGPTATIIDRPGYPTSSFGCGGDNYTVTIDDEGLDGSAELFCEDNPAIWGDLVGGDPPQPVLSVFDGLDLAGDWTLTVSDNAGDDVGSLLSWCLEIGDGDTSMIFGDGFESGNTSAWSSSVP